MALVKKAQQRLYFLRILRKNNLQEKLLVSYYRFAIESVLTYCISTWQSSCSTAERTALQRVLNTAQKIIGCTLSCLEDLFSSCCLNRAANILKDPSRPGHHLFDLLPSGHHGTLLKKAHTSDMKDLGNLQEPERELTDCPTCTELPISHNSSSGNGAGTNRMALRELHCSLNARNRSSCQVPNENRERWREGGA
ncbi:hypothetical protein NFI96_001785 [Prochilodus magdalenae]|nr:hypothetical protein NFI96_001785 [Prochilodus magdalenae]